MNAISVGVLAGAAVFAGAVHAADTPSADILKQALERRMLSLKPSEAKERNVLFEEVRVNAPTGSRYPFQVTGSVRDYDTGYPPNKYYGQTCVGRMDKMVYTLWKDAYGEWKVDGVMTLNKQCKPNPAEGVSSIPLASLAGLPATAAPAGKQAAKPAGPPALAMGSYECWHFSTPRLMLNFTLQPGGRYLDSSKKSGSYAFDAGSGRLSFKGAALDGQTPVYHAPAGRPTVSFRNQRNEEVDFCQHAG